MKQVVILTDEQREELEPWLLVPADQANAIDYITALERMRSALIAIWDIAVAVPTEPAEEER